MEGIGPGMYSWGRYGGCQGGRPAEQAPEREDAKRQSETSPFYGHTLLSNS